MTRPRLAPLIAGGEDFYEQVRRKDQATPDDLTVSQRFSRENPRISRGEDGFGQINQRRTRRIYPRLKVRHDAERYDGCQKDEQHQIDTDLAISQYRQRPRR